jgi:hypothetical protein
MKILLDYVFPISVIPSIPQASVAFLKKVAVVCKPKSGEDAKIGNLYECTTMSAVGEHVEGTGPLAEIQELFDAGMTRVSILISDTLDLAEALEEHAGEFFTLLISSSFSDAELATNIAVEEVNASLKIQDILYTAVNPGVEGNDITITYIADEADGDEALVTVDGDAITVDIDPAATTAETIADAVNLSVGASALVTALCDVGDEGDIQAISELDDVTPIPWELAGGVDEVLGEEPADFGTFDGVVGVASTDMEFLAAQSIISNRCGFFKKGTNYGKNMFYAFGKFLSNQVNWLNQQYIEMPFDDEVSTLGAAESLFDDKVSFVIQDEEFGNRLGLFCAGGKAIVAPYILKNLRIDMQSKALQWIASNQPQYTIKEAA